MRVVFTTYGYPDDRQAFIERYVRGLGMLGVDVCVIASAGPRRRRTSHAANDGSTAPHVVAASWRDGRTRKALTLLSAMSGALRHHPRVLGRVMMKLWRNCGLRGELFSRAYVLAPVLSQPADIVHLGWLTSAARSMELVDAIDRPLVVSCHGSDLRIDPIDDDEYRARVAAVFARVDLVHCVSDELAGRAVALGAAPEKVFVRAWGVDTERFTPRDGRPDDSGSQEPAPIRILSVGRLHWVKGYEFALLALAEVCRAGVPFEYTIIGDGRSRDRRAVLTAIRDLGLEGRVQLLDRRTQDEVLAALRSADLLLVASVSEGMSTVALEAMAVGVPVVVTDVGGMREAVCDGVEGRLVPARDPAALASAVCELASDPPLRAAMGRRGRRRAVEAFDSGDTARLLLEQYRRLVDHRPGEQPDFPWNGDRALS